MLVAGAAEGDACWGEEAVDIISISVDDPGEEPNKTNDVKTNYHEKGVFREGTTDILRWNICPIRRKGLKR